MSDKSKGVSIIIPNYNGRELLLKNLPSILRASLNKSNNILEIIIVDDASSDESVKVIKEQFLEIRLIKHRMNRGFAATVNTGVRSSKGKFVVLLNNDVLPKTDFLKSVFRHFKNEDVFAVSLHEKGYGWAKAKFENGFIVHEPGRAGKKSRITFWASGGSAVFRRDLWIKMGGFDERLFKFYWEDVDLSYRAAKRGYRIIWEPNAKVTHKHESTTSRFFSTKQLSRMQERNQLIFIWKNLTSPNMFRKHLLGLFRRLVRHPGYIRIFLPVLFKTRMILKARKKETKQCKTSDEAIFAGF